MLAGAPRRCGPGLGWWQGDLAVPARAATGGGCVHTPPVSLARSFWSASVSCHLLSSCGDLHIRLSHPAQREGISAGADAQAAVCAPAELGPDPPGQARASRRRAGDGLHDVIRVVEPLRDAQEGGERQHDRAGRAEDVVERLDAVPADGRRCQRPP